MNNVFSIEEQILIRSFFFLELFLESNQEHFVCTAHLLFNINMEYFFLKWRIMFREICEMLLNLYELMMWLGNLFFGDFMLDF